VKDGYLRLATISSSVAALLEVGRLPAQRTSPRLKPMSFSVASSSDANVLTVFSLRRSCKKFKNARRTAITALQS